MLFYIRFIIIFASVLYLLIIKLIIMTKLQLDMFLTNQLLVLKTGMELTASAKKFRASFKRMMGIPRNASHKEVVFYIGHIYNDNGIFDEFVDKLKRHKMEHLLDEVTYTNV
jgi:hypothetical protein